VLTYEATVPANTTATLYLPASSEQSVKESGKRVQNLAGIKFLRFESGRAIYELNSGIYTFTSTIIK
jgi:alpha-L-rhamnosidase